MTSYVNLGSFQPIGASRNKAIVFNIKTMLFVCLSFLYLNMAVTVSSVIGTNFTVSTTIDYDLNNDTDSTTTSYQVALDSTNASNVTHSLLSLEPTIEPTVDPNEEANSSNEEEVNNSTLLPDDSTEEPPINNVTQSLDSHATAVNSDRTEVSNGNDTLAQGQPSVDRFNWPETQNVLTTMSPQIRQQQETLSNSSNSSNISRIASVDSDNNTTTTTSNINYPINATNATSSSSTDDDLVDAVYSLTNSTHNHKGDVDEDDLIGDMAREGEKTEAKSSGGDGLNDLEDSSSNVNVASVSAPQSTLMTGKQQQQLAKQTKHQLSDQLSEPSTTRIQHQVWTASTSSDVDELSPDVISRMQNNVPFLAAYAVRPRIVRISKGSAGTENLSASSSSLVMGQPAATASNVDYSEIQVESSSTTSHHHKKQTKLKRKKQAAGKLSGKSHTAKQQKTSRRRKRQQLSLAQKRKLITMASRSLKKRRRSKQQQQRKRLTSGGASRRSGTRKSSRLRARGKASARIALMKRNLNRSNRLYHMNALKYGRYQQQQQQGSSAGDDSKLDGEDQITGRPGEKELSNSGIGATKGGDTKGGSATGGRKTPFYSGAKRNKEDSVGDDEQADDDVTDRDNKVEPLDGENPEVVSVEPKYDGVDDDPEYFDDGQNTNADRIDDVGEPKPNLDEDKDDRKTTATNHQEDNDDESDERIDGDQGRAARRDREQSQGKDDDAQTMLNRNNEDDSLSPNSHTLNAQGDKTTGGDASGLGGGIGGAASATGMDDSLATMGRNNNNNQENNKQDENDFNNKDNDGSDRANTDLDKTRTDEQEQDSFNGSNNDNSDNDDSQDSQERSLDRSNNADEVDDKDKQNTDKPAAGNKVDSNFGTEDNTNNGKRVTGGHAVENDHLPEGKPMDQGKDLNDSGNKKHTNDDDEAIANGDQMPRDKHDNSGGDGDHHGGHHDDKHNYDHHGTDSHCDHHGHHSHHDTIKWLQDAIPGEPNVDYPILWQAPKTKFNCRDQKYPGYYADVEARCQVFHVCQADGRQDSFLCPNGTIFSQTSSVCVWWNSFDCEDAPNLYERNSLLYKPMTSVRDGQQFDDFMGTFKNNGKRMQNEDSLPESDFMAGRGLANNDAGARRAFAEPTANEFDDDATIQRKSTDVEDDLEIDKKTADLTSGPRRKRRASRQPPKLNPRRKPPTRTAIRRRLRHGAKPRGRRA